MTITSDSLGDPERHLPFDDLCRALHALAPGSTDSGTVALIIRKVEQSLRQVPERVTLTPETGIPGDAWGRADQPDSVAQITVMQTDVATLIANGQPLGLFGDNLFLDMDLSAANLPVGARLQLGRAVVEVTTKPHNGCSKFRRRFGPDALRFVSDPVLRPRNLRGVYMHVVETGDVAVGDQVQVITRSAVRA